MTNEELLELTDLLLDKDMANHFREKFSENENVKISDYLGLRGSDLRLIAEEENKNIAAVKLFFILNDDIDENLKQAVLDIITKVNDKTILPKMITNIFEKKGDKAREIVALFEDATEENIENACSVIADETLIEREDLIDILEFVLETENSVQAKYVFDIVIDKDMQKNANYLNIIKLLSLAQNPDNLKYAYDFIVNEKLQKRPEFIAIIKLILNAKDKEKAKNALEIALDEDIQNSIDYLEIIQKFSLESKIPANIIKELFKDSNITQREDYMEIIEILINADNLDNAKNALEIALNPKLQKKRKYLKLIEKAANEK